MFVNFVLYSILHLQILILDYFPFTWKIFFRLHILVKILLGFLYLKMFLYHLYFFRKLRIVWRMWCWQFLSLRVALLRLLVFNFYVEKLTVCLIVASYKIMYLLSLDVFKIFVFVFGFQQLFYYLVVIFFTLIHFESVGFTVLLEFAACFFTQL